MQFKNIILVDNIDQIVLAEKLFLSDKSDNAFLPLNLITYEYLSNSLHNQILLYQKFKISENQFNDFIINYKNICIRLDTLINENIKQINEVNLKLFESNFNNQRGKYLEIINMISILSELKNYKSNKIIYFTNSEYFDLLDSFLVNNYFNEYQIELINTKKLNTKKSDVSVDQVNSFNINKNNLLKSIKYLFKSNLKFFFNENNYRKTLKDIFYSRYYFRIKSKNIFFIFDYSSLNVQPLLKKLKSNKNNILIFREDLKQCSHENLRININHIYKILNEDPLLQKLCDYKGFNFTNLYIEHSIDFLKKYGDIFLQNLIIFKKILNELSVKIFIQSNDLPLANAFFPSCSDSGVKIITFLHGGSNGYAFNNPIMQEYGRNSLDHDYFFLYTNKIFDFQNKLIKKFNPNLKYVVSGSKIFDDLFRNSKNPIKNKLSNKKINLCYVVGVINTKKKFSVGIENDIEQYVFLKNLINIFGGKKNINLHIKCGYNIEKVISKTISDVKRKFNNIYFINTGKSLVKDSKKIDLYLLSSLSTPLFEIVSLKKPIIFYLDLNRFEIENSFKNMLNKRVTLADSKDDLIKILNDLCKDSWNSKVFSENKINSNELYFNYCNNENTDPMKISIKNIEDIIEK